MNLTSTPRQSTRGKPMTTTTPTRQQLTAGPVTWPRAGSSQPADCP
jgi:hypothetical protein